MVVFTSGQSLLGSGALSSLYIVQPLNATTTRVRVFAVGFGDIVIIPQWLRVVALIFVLLGTVTLGFMLHVRCVILYVLGVPFVTESLIARD